MPFPHSSLQSPPGAMVKLKQLLGGFLGVFLGLLILLVVIGLSMTLILGAAFVWDEVDGYLGSYWERYRSTYDPKLGVSRCLDENGNLMDFEPPCLVMTLRGRKAMERHQKTCEENGGEHNDCRQEAFRWVESSRPAH